MVCEAISQRDVKASVIFFWFVGWVSSSIGLLLSLGISYPCFAMRKAL